MNIFPTLLEGCLLIEPDVFIDERGYFAEQFQIERYRQLLKYDDLTWMQSNFSHSYQGVIRGMHLQRNYPQGKLISCVAGEIQDIAVDLRPHSPTFGAYFSAILSDTNHHQMWLPEGFAHGFEVLSNHASVLYFCTDVYHPEDECTILWNDGDLNLPWFCRQPLLSPKDQNGISFQTYCEQNHAN